MYGQPYSSGGDEQFPGHKDDPESGLHYNLARSYDPSMSRWISADKVMPNAYDPQSLNKYSYNRNDPVNLLDPSGNSPWSSEMGGSSTVCTVDGIEVDCGLAIGMLGNGFGAQIAFGTPQAFYDSQRGGYQVLNGVVNGIPVYEDMAPTVIAPPPPKEPIDLAALLAPFLEPAEGTVTVTEGSKLVASKASTLCEGTARVLQGNAETIGRPGGFSGSTVGNILVTKNGAAIIPSQWGMSKNALRPLISQISGLFPNANAAFQGIVDIVGSSAIRNVQRFLMNQYPGQLIIELPGTSQDYGTTAVIMAIPNTMGCPIGTTKVR
jgi:RHS repeat-associated protein